MKLSTGEYEILGSGVVLEFSYGQPMDFQIREDFAASEEFKIRLIIASDGRGHRIDLNGEDPKLGVLTFWNMSNDVGTDSALEIGTINDKRLFSNFRVITLEEKAPRNIIYTFYVLKRGE